MKITNGRKTKFDIYSLYKLIDLIYFIFNKKCLQCNTQPKYDIKLSNNIFDLRTKYIMSYIYLFRYNFTFDLYSAYSDDYKQIYSIDNPNCRINLFNIFLIHNGDI